MTFKARQYVVDDLSIQESWRLFKIMSEFVDGFEELNDLGPAVSIFGSGRVQPGEPLFEEARELARKLSEAGYAIITGGGAGLMHAANLGARDAGGQSVGLHIELPLEEEANPDLTTRVDFKYFFVRKVMFVKYAMAYITLPGGIGTLNELFEAFVLIQTKRIRPFPIILYKSEFWNGMLDWLRGPLMQAGFATEQELDMPLVMDTPDEVLKFISRHVVL